MSVTFGRQAPQKKRQKKKTKKNKKKTQPKQQKQHHIPEYCSIHFCSLFLISQIAAVLSHDPLTNIFGSVGFIETLITSPL